MPANITTDLTSCYVIELLVEQLDRCVERRAWENANVCLSDAQSCSEQWRSPEAKERALQGLLHLVGAPLLEELLAEREEQAREWELAEMRAEQAMEARMSDFYAGF